MFWFGAAQLPDTIAQTSERFGALLHQNNKAFMSTVSGCYWGKVQYSIGRRYFEYEGGIGLDKIWTSIIKKQNPEMVEIVTWNDFNESYIGPAENDKQIHYYLDPEPREFIKNHQAYTYLNKYYIDWYKSGIEPPIVKNTLYYFYRTHSKNAIAADSSVSWKIGPIADSIYITTLFKDSATLKIESGNLIHTYTIPPGRNHGRFAFMPGAQRFSVNIDGKIIIDSKGPNIDSTIKVYNFYLAAGFAEAEAKTSLQINNSKKNSKKLFRNSKYQLLNSEEKERRINGDDRRVHAHGHGQVLLA